MPPDSHPFPCVTLCPQCEPTLQGSHVPRWGPGYPASHMPDSFLRESQEHEIAFEKQWWPCAQTHSLFLGQWSSSCVPWNSLRKPDCQGGGKRVCGVLPHPKHRLHFLNMFLIDNRQGSPLDSLRAVELVKMQDTSVFFLLFGC